MRFSSYAMMVVYFMTALGLLATSLVESIRPAFVALMAAIAAFSLVLNVRGKRVISGSLWNAIAGAVLVMFLADYLFVTKSLITASSMFLTVLLALKLFDVKGTRDYMILFSIVFFQIIAAASTTVSPVFLVILILFIIGAIFAMVILNIKRDWDEWVPPGRDIPKGLLDTPFFLTVLTVSVISLTTGFALFFLMPRMATGFFESKTLNTVKVTGFSEKVDLGSIGPVKADSTVVMRVEVAEPDFQRMRTVGPLYFRGTALDRYDGTSWVRSAKEMKDVRKDQTGSFVLVDPGGVGGVGGAGGGPIIRQVIYLEPLETEVLFAASHALSVAGRFSALRVDSGGSIFLPSAPYARIVYTAISRPGAFQKGPLSVSRFDLDVSAADRGEAGGRLKGLLEGVTKGRKTPVEKALAIEGHLKTGYGYTLDPKRGAGLNPLDDFLFFSREGYCEHYATAMALMLRLSGIPSRLVTGFLEGEWNSYGNYFIVRQRDAHSWVEAYIEGEGWMSFDPTPQAGTAPYETRSRLLLYLDAFRLKWNRHIINYTFTDQQRIGLKIESQTSALFNSLREMLGSPGDIFKRDGSRVLRYVFVFLLAVAAFFAYWLLSSKRGGRGGALKGQRTPQFYLEMLSILEKRGIKRAGCETPLEFALRTDDPDVMDVTGVFQDERYGGVMAGVKELERIRAKVEGMKG